MPIFCRAREASTSTILASAGAAKAVVEGLPKLSGKLGGSAMREPAPNVSAVGLTLQADRDVTVDKVSAMVGDAARAHKGHVLAYDPELKVRVDFNHTEHACIFASDQTKVLGRRMVRVLAWHDSDWAFSARMAGTAAAMGRLNRTSTLERYAIACKKPCALRSTGDRRVTNSIALGLGIVLIGGIALDVYLTGSDHVIYLARKLAALIEWIAFWR